MNWIDLVVVLIIIFYAYIGWKRGFILTLTSLTGIVVSLLAALFLYRYLASPLTGLGIQPTTANLIAFVLVIFIVDALYWLIAYRIIRSVVSTAVMRSPVNRVFGALVGTVKGLLLAAVLLMVLVAMPLRISEDTIGNSAIGEPMLRVGSWLERTVVSIVPEDVLDGLTFKTVPPEDGQRIKIPASTNVRVNQKAEAQMLALVNRERTQRGLSPVSLDSEVREVAREHSRDMFKRGYFSHVNPDGQDPFERMREAGINYTTAGENLAFAPTVRIAHEGLMDSPGHRANILNPRFRRLGVGAYTNPTRGTMFTQKFRN